jgi:hypothetical protein
MLLVLGALMDIMDVVCVYWVENWVNAAGLTVQGSPTDDSWSSGRRRCISRFPAADRPEKDDDALRCESLARRSSRPGGSSKATSNDPVARSISSSSPRFSALRSALDQDRSPLRPVDETFGIPFASPANFPSVLHPEGLRFLGVLLGCRLLPR